MELLPLQQPELHYSVDSGGQEEGSASGYLFQLLQLAVYCWFEVRQIIFHYPLLPSFDFVLLIDFLYLFSWCYPEQQGLVLWYAHYDNNPSFSDYTEFGCWSKPNIKQYAGDKYVCSFDWDLSTFYLLWRSYFCFLVVDESMG